VNEGVPVTAEVWRAVEQIMGLPVSVALRGRHAGDAAGHQAWGAVVAELREVDRTFSTYREDSWISRLDRDEVGVADCPPEVAEVLALGERARLQSGGAFAVRRPGPDGRAVLDPSGVVKGWAVQRAARILERLAGTDFCLSAGGDMVCHVADPAGPPWQVGIEDPRDPARLVARIPVLRGAVATSGTVHRGAHIVDARTGRTPSELASVTVVGDDLTWVDIEATTAFAMGSDGLAWLRTRPGRVGVSVDTDGRVRAFASDPVDGAAAPSAAG